MAKDPTKYRVEVNIIYDDDVEGLDAVDVSKLDGRTELEPTVNRDLDAFAAFYAQTLSNGALSDYERAAIKTYLWWKTHSETT